MERTYTVEEIEEFQEFMAEPGRRAAFGTLKRRYDRVFSAIFATPWAILDSYMEVVATVVVEHLSGTVPTAGEIEERLAAARRRSPAPDESERGVAVIPIHGTLIPKGSALAESSGASSVAALRSNFRGAMADPRVAAIVLDVDSPGGNALQIPEMAGEIRAARSKKPVVAAISGIGASGAYWLASQADEVVVTPSGLVGSIGVVSAHEDVSAAAEAKGVRVTLISAGKYKTEGNSLGPLSDEGLAHAQSMVDEFYGMFVSDVAKGRRVPVDDVRNGYGEGRVVNARAAVAANLVDRIATVEDVVGELLSASAASSPATTSASIGFVEIDAEVAEIDAETEDAEAAYFLAGADAEDYRAAAARADAEFLALASNEDLELDAAVDNSTWDGNRAMGQCSSASDYRSICAGERTTGEPDERQHWALPHHYLGRGPNAAGVRNALARLPQTQGLANRGAAESHLRGHMREISPESSADAPDWLAAIEAELAIQSVPLSRKSE